MTTSNPPGNTVLVLNRPMINGQTESVVGAMVGLSKAAHELVADGEGAVVIVDPQLPGTTYPGDSVELWSEDDPAVLDSETISDPNDKTILRIPKGRLHADRVNKLFYTIRRGSNNIGTSLVLTVLYNWFRPGLKDRMTEPGGHSELDLLLPDEIKNGVNADFVTAQVCIAYPYCRAYDLISLKCNGELLEPKPIVNPNQAPQPPNPGSEDPITVCFTVDRAFLDRAKRLDNKLNFFVSVTDQLGNGPDPDAPWSPVQTVDEDLDGKRLPMPILLEQMADYPGDNAEEIDLEKLAGGPLLLIVLTIDPRFVVGYEVIATYTAKNTGQPADVVVTVSGKVEADPFGQNKPCILEVPNDKIFAKSNVSVTYELRKPNGDLVGSSKAATATVTGSAPVNLQPPTLVDPAVVPIDVLAYPNGVTVRIEYLGVLKGDRARLAEVNAPAGSSQFPLVEFNSNKRVNTVLSPAFLAARHGKVIELRWNLNRNGGQAGKSDPVKLSVLEIVDEDPRLPTPNIEGKTSQELEIYGLPEDAKIHIDTWTFQRAGQLVDLTLEGTDSNNTSVRKVLLDGGESPPAEGLTFPAPIDWLIKLKDRSTLWILFSARFIDTATKINFPRRNYTAYVLNPLGIEKWENEPINTTFPLNTPITIKSGLTVTSLSSAGNCYIAGVGHLLVAKHCAFSWKGQGKSKVTVSTVSFWDTAGNTITSHDIAGNIIQTFNTSNNLITFIGAPNRLIYSITIKAIQEPDIGGYCGEITWE